MSYNSRRISITSDMIMNKTNFVILVVFLAAISTAKANGLADEIRSGQYCKTKVFDNFKLIEKSGHKALTRKPGGKLLEYAVEAEMMCPWSVEFDLNGDGDRDWIGYVKKDSQFYLLAYLSGLRKYSLEQIASSPKPPSNQFLGKVQIKTVNKLSGKNFSQSKSKFALQVTTLQGMTDIYLWNGKKLKKVVSIPQAF